MEKSFKMKRALVKTPAHVFKHCPWCESPNLMDFDGDVFCEYCDWNSIAVRAEARSATQHLIPMWVTDETADRETRISKEAALLLSGVA